MFYSVSNIDYNRENENVLPIPILQPLPDQRSQGF